ncbi:hypothetical protein SAICODRAFT_6041 [Saitoella complicata NRRL Y-17804]|uniref:L-ornithine N(5)-monooxygenase [NAD(P)H] n=1 Tax=Saitoella complicata (strain BCRC 22490 / CBS 7301 / JCM 7358 / NBRC 10748 / NRRL Y-17804) TaxID=698492 RepID=A0A0E9NKY8_SAICN|nr:uncharacterized protein SAICODRAFT_6041 [Saitoella complicata NRRL Y-17804]ODQ54850.1 hypothetical protein SAICODRAFT_6041 [Saitoella complicata NRRL Y-17804]GAO50542.1 hypothetical protein G7K_4666-t1 [Saitoella complicata NRRL Y-17804]
MSTSHTTCEAVESENFYDLIIVGAGPHALAVAARLYEETPSSLYTDVEHQRLHWLRRYSSVPCRACAPPRVLVLDRLGGWMTQWDRQFKAYDIKHLRSPMFFHPDPRDLDSLVAYAETEGRQAELVEINGVVGKELSKHCRKCRQKSKGKTAITRRQSLGVAVNERSRQDYFTPSTRLFRDFCDDVISRYRLENLVQQGAVTEVQYGHVYIKSEDHLSHDAFTLTVEQTGQTVRFGSRALVLATGAGAIPSIPDVLTPTPKRSKTTKHMQHESNAPLPQHEGYCHSSALVTRPFPQNVRTLAIIGGGLTSAQIVNLALKHGVKKVFLLCRSHLKVKPFDVDLDWLGKYQNVQKMAFWQEDDPEARVKQIRGARNGGSITPPYHKILKEHVKRGKLEMLTETQIKAAAWDPEQKRWQLELTSKCALPNHSGNMSLQVDYIVSATGSTMSIEALPFLQNLQASHPVDVVCGFPHITDDLQWNEKVPLFVVGGYAALQLGPGAFNLAGSREAAERIANRLNVLWKESVLAGASADAGYRSAMEELVVGNRYAAFAEDIIV